MYTIIILRAMNALDTHHELMDFRTNEIQTSESSSEYLRNSQDLTQISPITSHSFSTKGPPDRLCGYTSSVPCTRSSKSKTRSPPTGTNPVLSGVYSSSKSQSRTSFPGVTSPPALSLPAPPPGAGDGDSGWVRASVMGGTSSVDAPRKRVAPRSLP